MSMRPCQECKKNKWKYRFFDETRVVKATCLECGYAVEFKAKPRKPYDPNKVGAEAHYKIIDGKRYLKIEGMFVEVDLVKVNNKGKEAENGKYLRVMPV